MQAQFVQEGNRIDYTPSSAVAAGDVVVIVDVIGVATGPIAANTPGSLAVSGIFAFAKSSGSIALGTILYWNDSSNVVTATGGSNKRIGPCVKAAASDDTTVEVLLVAPGQWPVLGYSTGVGGAVTQGSGSGKATEVTLNTPCGTITTDNASLAGGAEVAFTVNCSAVKATDVVAVSIKSGGFGGTGTYVVGVTAVGAGTFQITIGNVGATAGEIIAINYAVIPAVAA